MVKKIKVGISGVGGDVGQGVIKSLEASKFQCDYYLLSSEIDSAWLYLYKNSFLSPRVTDPNYLKFIERFISKFDIEVFIPTIDSEITLFANASQDIEKKTGCKIFINSVETVTITQDKWKTYKFLNDGGFFTPHTVIQDEAGLTKFRDRGLFPLISKPRSEAGSRNIKIVYNETQMRELTADNKYILQDYLGDSLDELTCGVYLDDSYNVIGIAVLKRTLSNGSTKIAERLFLPQVEEQVAAVARGLRAKYLNIQGKYDGQELVIFELNGRLSGTVAMVSRIFNAPELFISEKLHNEKLKKTNSLEAFIAIRFQDEIYTTSENVKDLILRSREL